MYLIIIFFFIILCVIVINTAKSENILKMSFWLFVAYGFLLITHLFSGIHYNSGSLVRIFPYFLLCIFLVVLGEILGKKIKTKNAKTIPVNSSVLSLISIFGSIILVIDTFRLNQINFGLRIEDQSLSVIGVVGTILSSLGIISWLSNLYEYRINGVKIYFLSYLSLISYVISDVLAAGRQSLLLIVISTLIVFIWSRKKSKQTVETEKYFVETKIKTKPKLWGMLLIALVFFSYFLVISSVRSQILDIGNKVDMFESGFNAKTSKNTIKLTKSLGPFSDIYIESLYYYSHELIRLDLFFDYYDYHPLFGLEQLPYLERRVQWIFGKQSENSWKEVESSIEGKGKFSCHTWGTFITNMIVDFGRVGAPIACFLIGLFSGIFFLKFKKNQKSLEVVRQSLICAGIVFSIQFSPFVQLAWAFPLFLSSYLKIKY